MPHMVKIYTKKGDEGQTSLFGGQRISKSDPRPEAFGTLDEVCAILGVARAAADNPDLQAVLHSIQEGPFLLGGGVGGGPGGRGGEESGGWSSCGRRGSSTMRRS